jgi:hypothetical protein
MEMGSDQIKMLPMVKDEIEEQLGRELLKIIKKRNFKQKVGRWEKSTVRDFLTPKTWKMIKKWVIAIYRKSGPTKSTVLGPGPPPGEIHKIYWFLSIFHVLGAFNRAGKTVTKVGIYSLPPQNWCQKWIFIEIYRKLTF